MSSIREKLTADVKSAMIARESVKLDALRFLQAAIKNREIELRPNPIAEEDILAVIKKLAKQRKESIEQFQAAGRQDLVTKETFELHIIEAYLPAQMGREQIEQLVVATIERLGAKTIKDMGMVMKEVIAKSAGTADNKTVSEIIKSKLS